MNDEDAKLLDALRLAESLTAGELADLKSWWRATRHGEEALSVFLARQGVVETEALGRVLAASWGEMEPVSSEADTVLGRSDPNTSAAPPTPPSSMPSLEQPAGDLKTATTSEPSPSQSTSTMAVTDADSTDPESAFRDEGWERLRHLMVATSAATPPLHGLEMARAVSAGGSTDLATPFEPPRPSDAMIGQLVSDRYLLVERLGQGGYGVVYYGLDTRLNRPVAVKLLRTDVADPGGGLAEIIQEAGVLGQLNHPNIVTIWDFADRPQPFLALEFVDGASLEDLIARSGRLQLDRALEITLQVVAGLEAAARLGVVHRDVKPANILMHKSGQAKLTDFGLAVLSGGVPRSNAAGDAARGTAYYMSPEQAADEPIDHRSDIYSLGVTLYQALTGVMPIDGETRMEVLLNQSLKTPQPPHLVVPGLHPEVSRVVLKMLAKCPEDRHQSYRELADDLKRLRSGRSSSPSATGRSSQGLNSGAGAEGTVAVPSSDSSSPNLVKTLLRAAWRPSNSSW